MLRIQWNLKVTHRITIRGNFTNQLLLFKGIFMVPFLYQLRKNLKQKSKLIVGEDMKEFWEENQ